MPPEPSETPRSRAEGRGRKLQLEAEPMRDPASEPAIASPVAARASSEASSSGQDGADGAERVQVDRAKVEKVITTIRPAIQADGGDIELVDVDVDTGVVTVELLGACVSCPASTLTLKAGIERILKDRVPGVTEVLNSGEAEFDLEGTPLSL